MDNVFPLANKQEGVSLQYWQVAKGLLEPHVTDDIIGKEETETKSYKQPGNTFTVHYSNTVRNEHFDMKL